MRTCSLLLGMFLLIGGLSAPAARAQVVVRGNVRFGPPPRAYYGPRLRYYPPRPAVVYAVPPPVVVAPAPVYAPAPYYVAPPPVYYAPRPRYGWRGRGYHGRRW